MKVTEVSEVKALLPRADIYELSSNARYVMLVNNGEVSRAEASLIAKQIGAILIMCSDPSNAMRLLEIDKETD